MPLTSAMANAAMRDGYTFACATCKNLHRAREQTLPGCMALIHNKKCSGPFGGGSYQEYDGIVPRNRLHEFCFVCGAKSDAGVETPGDQDRVIIGICDKHLPLLESVSRDGTRPPFVTKVAVPVLRP